MSGGINNFSPVIGNNASQVLKNLQALIAANPDYLTNGIPTHLIQQMWKNDPMEQPKVVTTNMPLKTNKTLNFDVCFGIIFFYYYNLFKLNSNFVNVLSNNLLNCCSSIK